MKLQVFGCPACQQPFQVAESQSGQVVQCPACAQQVEIPASAFAETPPPPAQQEAYICPQCSGQFGITSSMYGHHVGCPHCQTSVLVQAPDHQPEAVESPAIDTDTPVEKKKKSGKRWKSPAKPRESKDMFAPGFENPNPSSTDAETPIKPVRRKTKEKPRTTTAKTESRSDKPAADNTPSKDSKTKPSKDSKPAKPAAENKPAAEIKPPTEDKDPPKKSKPSVREKSPSADLAPPSRNRGAKVKPKPPSERPAPPVQDDLSPPEPTALKPGDSQVKPTEPEVVESEEVVAEVVNGQLDAETTENQLQDESADRQEESQPEFEPLDQPDPIDHLLPPRFDVLDPTRLNFNAGKDQFKVFLPDGKGGTQQVDQRVVRVQHDGEQVSLVAMTEKEKHRRRLIQNIVAVVIGIIIMWIAFSLLR